MGEGKIVVSLKNNNVSSTCPLAMGLLRTHIPFSTTVILHAASFAVFYGGGLFLVSALWGAKEW
ncbi:hypothetical protein GCM10023262_13380 [Bartonella pachyuromydis]|uniref:Uncharacterized protein n=1 Tax=Bartonella pachyuromydis TaxID=931097 RepID=A0ABP8VN04_9HYPH